MLRRRFSLIATVLLTSLSGGVVFAQDDTRTVRIQFKKGASGAVVNGQIKGNEYVDYLIEARQGQAEARQRQAANISLATRHPATYFNILAPGKTDEAFFNGSLSQNQFDGVLPGTGTYRVRVYMMRAEARRHEDAGYRLEVVIGDMAAAARVRALLW